MIHSILMIGQSNMAGRGKYDEVPLIKNDRIKMMRNGRWQPLFRPVNPDRAWAGASLAESFADEYSKAHPDVEVGLIPCADGGTGINMWSRGGVLFDHAVFMAKLAQRSSHIVAVIWHQGEADCKDEKHPLYAARLSQFITDFRRESGLSDVPFIMGELGYFLSRREDSGLRNYPYVNEAMRRVLPEHERIALASAEGLESNIDNLHFRTEALYEFGRRYYRAFAELETAVDTTAEKESVAEQSEMERL